MLKTLPSSAGAGVSLLAGGLPPLHAARDKTIIRVSNRADAFFILIILLYEMGNASIGTV